MRVKILLLAFGFLLTSVLSVLAYNRLSEVYKVSEEKVLGEQEPEAISAIALTPTLTLTQAPIRSPKPTLEPIPTNTPVPTSSPNLVSNTNNQQLSGGSTNSNVISAVPTQSNNASDYSEYEEWSASQPKDSRGVLCALPDSRCKYECSVADYWVDDHLKILNNHFREYLIRLEIYEPDSNNVKIWEDAVMDVYNMIYDECKDSPIYNPQNPL